MAYTGRPSAPYITTLSLVDGAVTMIKLANNAVSYDKLHPNTVGAINTVRG